MRRIARGETLSCFIDSKVTQLRRVGRFIRIAEISAPPLERVSAMANWLNGSDSARQNFAPDQRAAVFLPLAGLMEAHLSEATSTDLSRLGWLYLNSGEAIRAKEIAELGIARDNTNIHCAQLHGATSDRTCGGNFSVSPRSSSMLTGNGSHLACRSRSVDRRRPADRPWRLWARFPTSRAARRRLAGTAAPRGRAGLAHAGLNMRSISSMTSQIRGAVGRRGR